MAYESDHPQFRSLTNKEEEEFRDHARRNKPPVGVNWELFHPVCREEWKRRGILKMCQRTCCRQVVQEAQYEKAD